MDSYSFLSSSLDSLVNTIVNNSIKTLENLKKNVDDDEIKNTVNEMKIIAKEGRYNNASFKDSTKDFRI